MLKYILTLLLMFATLAANGQKTVAEEVVRVDASSATVYLWFGRIEKQANIVLSYNPSMIDLSKRISLGVKGKMTVEQLLKFLLSDYDYRLIPMEGRKLLIQVQGKSVLATENTAAKAVPLERTVINVDDNPATIKTWFGRIESQGKLSLNYTPDVIDFEETVKFERKGQILLKDLVAVLLKHYDYKLSRQGNRTLFINILRKRTCNLTGIVEEEGSGEKLMGATLLVTDKDGNHQYAVTDINGFFNVNLTPGSYHLSASYMGYNASSQEIALQSDRVITIPLVAIPYEIKNVQVQRRKSKEELDEVAPSNLITFSNADLFSQIKVLPGVSKGAVNVGFSVSGGAVDENLMLLEGFPLHNTNHLNTMLSTFNGDAIKSVSFYNSFIPTQYEGRLSSATDVRLRDGNKTTFVNTLSLDMPAASAVLEGPIVKDKVSYLVAGRRSWLDFFDGFVSNEERINHTFYDFNLKLAWDIDSVSSLKFSAYNSTDVYRFPEQDRHNAMLHWNNQLYAVHFNTLLSPKMSFNASMAYTRHLNRANAEDYGVDTIPSLRSGSKAFFLKTEFDYNLGNRFQMRWGLKGNYERYELAAFGMGMGNKYRPVKQFAVFYDTRLRLTPWLSAHIGFNSVLYKPNNYQKYFSFQPRLSLKTSLGNNDLLYLNLGRMEQFHHHVLVADVAASFDFIMPSIGKFAPSKAYHTEFGWKHYFRQGALEVLAYYKHRHNLLALRPDVMLEDSEWSKYIMSGNGNSFGLSLYFYNRWKRLNWQLSYTLSKTHEWFSELPERGKMPSLYDVPHVLNAIVSYDFCKHSAVTLGANLHSGKVRYDSFYYDIGNSVETFRTDREPFRYRLDASYSFRREYKNKKLLLRFGLFNILGNPSDDELFYYFSVKIKNHCIPYGSITFKF